VITTLSRLRAAQTRLVVLPSTRYSDSNAGPSMCSQTARIAAAGISSILTTNFSKKSRATKQQNIPLPKIFERPKQVWHSIRGAAGSSACLASIHSVTSARCRTSPRRRSAISKLRREILNKNFIVTPSVKTGLAPRQAFAIASIAALRSRFQPTASKRATGHLILSIKPPDQDQDNDRDNYSKANHERLPFAQGFRALANSAEWIIRRKI
jgi:hypothetical protein